MKKLVWILLITLIGCSSKDDLVDNNSYCRTESLGEWEEIVWLHSIQDPLDDYVFHGGSVGPDPVVEYPSSNLTEARLAFDDDYLYTMFVFEENFPEESYLIDSNGEELYIHSQGMNLAINFDFVETQDQTGTLWGVDAFFAVNISYSNQCIEAYAPYEFDSTDIHSMTSSIYGDSHPTLGGFGTNYVITRYPIELIKSNLEYDTFEVFGWAEAEGYRESKYSHDLEARFHEFVHDDLETTYYKNKST